MTYICAESIFVIYDAVRWDKVLWFLAAVKNVKSWGVVI